MFCFLLTFGSQSQFRFDNECNISLPENHKRVSEANAPKLDAEIPPLTLPEVPETQAESQSPESPEPASQDEDTKAAGAEEASVVVKEDATPRGRRMADEAREVAAAHASLLVDIEACKRVSMSRRPLSFSIYVFVLLSLELQSILVTKDRSNFVI